MVIVGGIWMKWSRIDVADCETLDAAPLVNDCGPELVRFDPPWLICEAPAITPSAIDVPKICT